MWVGMEVMEWRKGKKGRWKWTKIMGHGVFGDVTRMKIVVSMDGRDGKEGDIDTKIMMAVGWNKLKI